MPLLKKHRFVESLHLLTSVTSVGKKRKFIHAFLIDTYEDERYGQHIDVKFFVTNQGHRVKN